MNIPVSKSVRFALMAVVLAGAFNASSETRWYGGADDVAFATNLWSALVDAKLVGKNALPNEPYAGTHPHGAILETVISTITVNGVESMVVAKRSYRGQGVSVEAVSSAREKYLDDVTVMFKREEGYDSPNQNWFWAKYNADGSLAATPNGVHLAGRIAKGKSKGCIACHRKAEGDDFLFVN